MAYKRSHYIALLFSLFALVLWIFSNLGTTISSSVLAETFVVQAIQTKTGQSIRYGIYNSCIYSNKSQIASCSPSSFGYQIDVNQLAQINSVDPDAGNKISQIISTELKSALALQKVSVLVMPAAVLSFISVCVPMLMRRMRTNNILPILGGLASIAGCVCGALSLAVSVGIYRTFFEALERAVDGLLYYWGPEVYITGAACACQIIACGFFVGSCIARRQMLGKRHNHSYRHYIRHSFDEASIKSGYHAESTNYRRY